MPLNDHLPAFRAQEYRWLQEHLTNFHACLSDDILLYSELRGRESLSRDGSVFPAPQTPPAEVKGALELLDKGDSSGCQRRSGDAERPLIIVDEEQYIPASIRRYMPLSTALLYDAALAHAFAQNAERTDGITQTITALASKYPDEEIEVLDAEKESILLKIRLSLAQEIIILEHKKTFAKVLSLPRKWQHRTMGELCPQEHTAPLVRVSNIVQLQDHIAKITPAINYEYEKACASLNEFLVATSRCRKHSQLESEKLIARVDSLSAKLQRTQTISEFLAFAKEDIKKTLHTCAEAKRTIELTLSRPEIDESLKKRGRTLLLAYKAEEATINPINVLEDLALKLLRENDIIELNHLSTAYDDCRAELRMLADSDVADPYYTMAAQTLLLGQELDRRKKENLTSEIAKIRAEIIRLTDLIKEEELAREHAKESMQATIADPTIPDSFKEGGIYLIDEYSAAEKASARKIILSRIAVQLSKENETIKRRYKLTPKYNEARNALQTQVNDTNIPEFLKHKARELLHARWEYNDAYLAKTQIDNIIGETKRITARCQLHANYTHARTILQGHVDDSKIPSFLKRDAKELLAEPWSPDETREQQQLFELNKKNANIVSCFERYSKARDNLQVSLDNHRIPERLKTKARTLLRAEFTSYVEAFDSLFNEQKTITNEIEQLKAYCQNAIINIDTQLSDENIPKAYKENARRLLSAYHKANASEAATWDDVADAAKKLYDERQRIVLRQNFSCVVNSVSKMREYGSSLTYDGCAKGAAITNLSDKLDARINLFIATTGSTEQQDFAVFKDDFKELVHSQDGLMHQHRRIWNPLVANIILAITTLGISLIASIVKAATQPAPLIPGGHGRIMHRPNTFTHVFNHALFFAKTNSQKQLEGIENTFENACVVQGTKAIGYA